MSVAWLRNTGRRTAAQARARRPLLVAVAAWLIALSAVGYLVRLDLTAALRMRMVDLDVYRNGGRAILHGSRLYAIRSREGLLFTYPPLAALLAVPLALLSWQLAMLAWVPMIYVPLAVVIWFSFRPLLARAGRYAPAAFAGIFLATSFLLPMRQEIHYGQIDIFLVALCVLDCAAKRPRWPRGALIGLATAIKLVPGVFIVYLLITGRRKAAAVAAGVAVGLSGLAYLIAPRDSRSYWTQAIFNSRRLGPNDQAANQSLRGVLMRLFFPSATPVTLWLAVAAIVAVAGFLAARAVRRRGHELGGVAITGMLAALLSPVAWIHHFCWIVVALGVIIGDGRSRRRVLTAAALGVLFASMLPIWGKELWLARSIPTDLARCLEATFALGGLATIALIYRLRRAPAADLPIPSQAKRDVPDSVAQEKVLTGSREG